MKYLKDIGTRWERKMRKQNRLFDGKPVKKAGYVEQNLQGDMAAEANSKFAEAFRSNVLGEDKPGKPAKKDSTTNRNSRMSLLPGQDKINARDPNAVISDGSYSSSEEMETIEKDTLDIED